MSTQHNNTIAILRRRGGSASSQIAQSLTNWVERMRRTQLSLADLTKKKIHGGEANSTSASPVGFMLVLLFLFCYTYI